LSAVSCGVSHIFAFSVSGPFGSPRQPERRRGAVVNRRMVGRDPETGLTIAISSTPAARERANIVLQGNDALWFSPDEIATLVALDERAKKIADVKAAFPGAEIVGDVRQDRTHGTHVGEGLK
jgi:hypothetical protein